MSVNVLKASDLLAEYTFDGNSAAASNVSPVVDMGSWDSATGATTGNVSSGSAYINASETPSNGAIDPASPTSYHAFSFTVQNLDEGETLSVTNIKGDFFGTLHVGTGSNAGHRVALFSDQIGFVSNDDRIGNELRIDKNSATTSTPESINFDIVISEIPLSNLNNGDEVGFRFYFSDSSTHANAHTHRLDNIQLHGAINSAIPEPASCALVTGLLAAVMLGCRRPRGAFA